MKYDKAEIMNRAHKIYAEAAQNGRAITWGEALKRSWAIAKQDGGLKRIGYAVIPYRNVMGMVKIRIFDRVAIKACITFEFSGHSLNEALYRANKRLNPLGYQVCERLEEWPERNFDEE